MSRPLALRRAGAALALPLALGLGLSACADDSGSDDAQRSASESTPSDDSSQDPEGGDDKSKDGSPDSDGAASPATPKGADSPLASLNVEKGETVDGKKFAAVAEWALDNATTADIDLEASAQGGISGSGSVDHTTSPLSMQLEIETNGSKGDVRLVDGALYMSVPGMGDGKYLKMDVSNAEKSGPALSELDPSRSLKNEMSKKKFTYGGTDSVDGVRAQRFSAEGVDIWFDDEGMLRRVKQERGDRGTITATYSNWGSEVEIEAPPADQVQEMPSMPMAPKTQKG